MTADILAVALQAQQAGLSVVRVRNDGTKRPMGSWKQAQEQAAVGPGSCSQSSASSPTPTSPSSGATSSTPTTTQHADPTHERSR